MPFFVKIKYKMNVSREDVDALNAILKVKVGPADYEKNVAKQLEDYRKRANVPGFRKGHVPMGMLKKQYGKALLIEELNKLVNDSLYQYINEQKIDILGNPIPKKDTEVIGNFDQPGDFEFQYEIGLAPEFQIKLNEKSKFDFVKVKIDDALINKQLEDLRRRYGKLISNNEVSGDEMLLGQFVELEKNGEIKAGGVMNSSTISLEFIEDKSTKKLFNGKKVGDKVVVDIAKVSKGEADLASMLGIKKEDLSTIGKQFQFTINDIKKMEMAEMTTDLFNKVFGEGAVKTEEEAKNKIKEDLDKMFGTDSDRILTRKVYNELLDSTKIALPDNFLKRWIKLSNEKEITEEQIEAEYTNYSKGLKWQLIQGKLFKDNNVQFESQEAVEYTKSLLVNQYAQYGIPAPEDKELTESAHKVLSDKKEANQIYDMLAEKKLTELIKNTVSLKEKALSYDDFVKVAQEA
jgi:trigger factor